MEEKIKSDASLHWKTEKNHNGHLQFTTVHFDASILCIFEKGDDVRTSRIQFHHKYLPFEYITGTRKSSCVNTRGIPTAAYQVLHLLTEVGYPPCPGLMGGVPEVGYPPHPGLMGRYPRWGTPPVRYPQVWRGGVPEVGYPSIGYPLSVTTPHQVPPSRSDQGGPEVGYPALGTPHQVPPSRSNWENPRWGTPLSGTPPPPQLDLAGVPPSWTWLGYPPGWTWLGYPPPPRVGPGWGTPPSWTWPGTPPPPHLDLARVPPSPP